MCFVNCSQIKYSCIIQSCKVKKMSIKMPRGRNLDANSTKYKEV